MLNSELVNQLSKYDDDCEIVVIVQGDPDVSYEIGLISSDGTGNIELTVV